VPPAVSSWRRVVSMRETPLCAGTLPSEATTRSVALGVANATRVARCVASSPLRSRSYRTAQSSVLFSRPCGVPLRIIVGALLSLWLGGGWSGHARHISFRRRACHLRMQPRSALSAAVRARRRILLPSLTSSRHQLRGREGDEERQFGVSSECSGAVGALRLHCALWMKARVTGAHRPESNT
jgi:hypothetical protein